MTGSVDVGTSVLILASGVVGMIFAYIQFRMVAAVKLDESSSSDNSFRLLADGDASARMLEIYNAIREGADSFLFAEYKICLIFVVLFGSVVLVLTSYVGDHWAWEQGALTALAFVVGSLTSIVSGYLGMKVAVFSNARTTVMAMDPANPWTGSFNTAFRAGGVMGFALCGLGLVVLYALCMAYNKVYHFDDEKQFKALFECVAGFGLGGSSIALFGRVGGGIYTKAADVGADLAGKVVSGIPEDDPRNPATIADNVGDNVGDVAGMGSDLFGSFAEASCAALIVASSSAGLREAGWSAVMFPVMISAIGLLMCILTSFVATNFAPVKQESDVEKVLKVQIGVSTLLTTIAVLPVAFVALPSSFHIDNVAGGVISGTPIMACACIWSGLWAGCLIGFITEFYTSHSYEPTREVAQSCETGAATNIIYGLALGYKSAIIPVFLLAAVVYFSFTLLDMFGVALAALGMLGTLATGLTIDVYGPICDNAGGIAEMTGLPEEVRDVTDALDAAGNTTAAIGKGFAIGSACLVGLALFGAFTKRAGLEQKDVSILSPVIFAALLVGALIPYWFTAMTMKSVGVAANEMVKEVKRQFDTIPGLLTGEPGHSPPDHARCIEISTNASLREMILPGVLVMSTPLITGILFGTSAVAGLLAGSISSAVQMAISASNTGGAWDNAKKYVEKGCVYVDGVQMGKNSEVHKAAVVGDTVGDPLKDTSGPALNIVMKLMAILSVVFADFFTVVNNGHGLINWHQSS
ncbi:Pyrophosphate-energized vacuolar membrane proton pump [Hondaea fermentalgiana]|uniref:H(+)-exporting diphosphatase n=1 Tax=Hondaea fermentalgiana TaxID=2315210 RepID=A0A2R5G840_9STRA|nr:Pyrophosphate-energized vacuolar membrane proton pump [Hondaea fermentalgiana]|eukprot:GBG26715.1 Pyrophosphate-energized vacuolar membrane proton pump [Hondaea fermentalgiana]